MDIRVLRYFVSAAECLNFTKAAKECYITQTAMSQNISSMEKELGFRLFERNNRSVSLTPAGRDFYEQVKGMIHEYDTAVRHSRSLADGSDGKLVITFNSGLEALVFMPRLRRIRTTYPAVKVIINISPPRRMLEILRRGECDIAVTWPYDLQEMDGIGVQNLAEFKGCLVCSKDHPLASRSYCTLEDIANQKLRMLDLSDMPATYRAMCEEWKGLGRIPPAALSFDHIDLIDELIMSCCMEGTMALLPEYAHSHVGNDIAVVDLKLKSPLMFKLAAGYLERRSNPTIYAALEILNDKRIPLSY